jgi:hypothetical protein
VEPHPVPQDILNIEFKLFGAFSLSQFIKMVAGCLIGLFFFLLPIPSVIVKIPLVIAPIAIGVGIALVPRFSERFENFVKALFISPRYIWVKETQSPEFLQGKKKKVKTTAVKIEKDSKRGLEEISLDRMLAARDKSPEVRKNNAPIPKDKFDLEPREQNLDRVYDSVFQKAQAQKKSQLKGKVAQDEIPKAADANTAAGQRSPQDIQAQINQLKRQLSTIVKDQNYKEKEAEILSQINDLYHDLKMIGIEDIQQKSTNQEASNAVPKKITDFQGKRVQKFGQTVYGIVVDKKGQPIQDAEVFFDLKGSDDDVTVSTDGQGKFNSNIKILPGEYEISINHPDHKFHTYKIKVTDQKLPAYKLRSRN